MGRLCQVDRFRLCAALPVAVLLALILASVAQAGFVGVGTPFWDVTAGSLAWGDYDNDGDLDLAIGGYPYYATRIYRNGGGGFSDIFVLLTSVAYGSLAWGDYDNDGDLDLALTGLTDGAGGVSKIYRNNAGTFTDIGAGLPGVYASSLAWGDYDNDGDVDLALAGGTDTGRISKIYRNDAGAFMDIGAGLTGVEQCSLAWGDYDNDGDLDLAIAGWDGAARVSKLYRNNAGAFTDAGAGLTCVDYCSLAWGDYDNDGDLDLALAGIWGGGGGVSKIYRNNGGAFTDIGAGLTGVFYCSLAWGDYDNDGDLDLAIAGNTGSQRLSKIYRNDAGTFVEAETLTGLSHASVAWGDYDNDRDLDLAVMGTYADGYWVSKLYRNEGGVFNAPPSAPTGLSTSQAGGDVAFSWNAASDTQTPAAGLSYNLRVGTTPGDDDVFCGMANLSSGYRRLPATGNAQKKLSWTVKGLGPGYYYWSVQAVDTAFAGSSWVAEAKASTYPFIEIDPGLPGVYMGSVAWGDYDSDGDLDMAVAGDTGSGLVSKVCRNDGGTFTDIGAGLTGVHECSLAWGDYDNDGDLDLALAGGTDTGRISKIYRNDAGAFTDIGAALTGVEACSLAWGDYDNDGDLDLAIAGYDGSGLVSKVYRNDAGAFTDTGAALIGFSSPSLAWGDYDNDGDLDLVIAGYQGSAAETRIYRNNAGTFTNINAGLAGVYGCSLAWGDYDNDGDLDLALAGSLGVFAGNVSKIYRNNGGTFTDIGAALTGVYLCSIAWGDYDNDGDLDLALAGYTGSAYVSKLYRNDAGAFTDSGAGLTGVYFCSLAWGDYDNDGHLDLALAGYGPPDRITRIYRNQTPDPNTPPSAPTGLSTSTAGNDVTFSWDYNVASDAQTPPGGLSYNLRVGTTPGGNEVFSGMADSSSGYRRLPATGNTQKRLSWTIKGLTAEDYFWSVQAIDTAFAGSAWAAEANLLFRDIDAGLRGVFESSLAWGDYDNDGDLDLAVAGWDVSYVVSRIYRNNGGTFADINAGLPGVYSGSLAWADYDNDGDLDLALAGADENQHGRAISRVYRNDAGTFTDIGAGLPGVLNQCSLAWGDYDNDGDLDLALAGGTNPGQISKIYRNDAGAFTDINAGLAGVYSCSLAWGDYDNDGDLDLALAGYTGSLRVSKIYRNHFGTFTDINAGLTGVAGCSLAWGDYDNDGDLDLALAGGAVAGVVSKVYRNDAGTFTDIGAGLTGVGACSLAWGDYDNDGDLDLALAGSAGTHVSRIYRNTSGTFTDIGAGLPGVDRCSLAWGDYDNDGDLDLALAGMAVVGPTSKLYRNNANVFNTPPSAPTGLSATTAGDEITFEWNPATDGQTPANGLSYNLRVGTTPGRDDVFSGMADSASGYRRLPATGNAQEKLSWTIKGLSPRTYYWGVQAVDTAFAGSAWAEDVSTGLFTEIDAGLPGVLEGSVAWGDYDNDGDLDLALAGWDGVARVTRIYRNNAGTFTDINAGLTGVCDCSLAWGDYDNDGDLDLAVAGSTGSKDCVSSIYRNNGGTFTDINAGLTGVGYCSLAWGDYDNDGDLDLAVAGKLGGAAYVSKIYRNDAGAFTDIGAGLDEVGECSLAWGDYDNDGDLDLAIAGWTGAAQVSKVYRNHGGTFTDIGAGLTAVASCSLAWGDYDNDGDLDLALAGYDAELSGGVTRVYRNDAGAFTDIGAGLPGVHPCSLAWGDYDNDGDLDLAMAGVGDGSARVSRIYRNDAGTFTDINAGLIGVWFCSLAWGDYDNDGDLDLALMGAYSDGNYVSRLYRNSSNVLNTPPSAPAGLLAATIGDGITFQWSPASDAQTPEAGLSYNLRVGTTPGDDDVFCGMANLSTGYRRLPATGNAQKTLSWTIKGLTAADYFWSVQAVDSVFAGSPWAPQGAIHRSAGSIDKSNADGLEIDWVLMPVTAVWPDAFYIENETRAAGIRVEKIGHGLSVGMRAAVRGTIRTNTDGERYIDATTVVSSGTKILEPVFVSNKILGGVDTSDYDPDTGAGQRGVYKGHGLNNIGLLVQTLGRVKAATPECFYIDDGAGLGEGSIFKNGVRIICAGLTPPEVGQYVLVTGISSIIHADDRYLRVVRPRAQEDIEILQ